jgi:hypothetical protein
MPKFIECTAHKNLPQYANWTLVEGYAKTVNKDGHTYTLIKKERTLGYGDRILNILLGVIKSLFKCFTNVNSKEIQHLFHPKKEFVRLGLKIESTPNNLNFNISDAELEILKKSEIGQFPYNKDISQTEFPFVEINSIPHKQFTSHTQNFKVHIDVNSFIQEKKLNVKVAPTRLVSYLTQEGRSVEYLAQIRAERSNNKRIENMSDLIEIAKAGFQFTPFNSSGNYLVIENVSKTSADSALIKLINYAQEDQLSLFEEHILKNYLITRKKQIAEHQKVAAFHNENKIITGREPIVHTDYDFDELPMHYNTLCETVEFAVKHINKAFKESKATDPILIRNIRFDFGDIPTQYRDVIDPEMNDGLANSTDKEFYSNTFIGKALQHLVDQKVIHSWTYQRSALYVQA